MKIKDEEKTHECKSCKNCNCKNNDLFDTKFHQIKKQGLEHIINEQKRESEKEEIIFSKINKL